MSNLIKIDKEYAEWIKNLSQRFRQSQIKAAVKVNSEVLDFYWSLGRDIVTMKADDRWRGNFWKNLSQDLKDVLPGVLGFSPRNLQFMRQWYILYSPVINTKQVVSHPVSNEIGLLICKDKDDVVAKYSLEGYNQPMGISEYELSKVYPKDFKSSLPSIEDIERQLK